MKFFTQFFKKNKEITVSAIELDDWIIENMKEYFSEEYKSIKETVKQVNKTKKEIVAKLEKLENAKLVNPNLPEREVQMMEGNKDNYRLKTLQFLDKIEIPKDYLALDEFCNEFEEILTDFNEKTMRAYSILRNYFRNEMQEISMSLKKMETLQLNLFNFMKEDSIVNLKTILIKIKELNDNIVMSNKIHKEIRDLETNFEKEKEKQDKIDKKIKDLMKSPNYNKLKNYNNKKKEIQEDILNLTKKFVRKIKPFEKPFKKYVHDTKKHAGYIENPMQALEKDYQFSILVSLEKIQKNLESYNLKDNVIKKIKESSINKEFLKDLRKDYLALKEEKNKIIEKENQINVMQDFKELEYQKEHNEKKILSLKNSISDKKHLINIIQIDNKKKKLEEKLSNIIENQFFINLE